MIDIKKGVSVKIVDESIPLKKKNIEIILNYLPYFEDENQRFFEKIKPKRESGKLVDYIYVTYSNKFMEFYTQLHEQGFVTNFNWLDFFPDADDLSSYYALLDDSDLVTLRRLFTMIVRHDNHNEGFLAEVIESGLILSMLKRLKELNKEID